jgi:thymidylate synthase (FAD)
MHQCYCESDAKGDVENRSFDETWFGKAVVRHLLEGHRGHYGPLEGPSITFSVIGFPHCVLNQARTHRIGIEFNVQSLRYTSQRFCNYVNLGYYNPEAIEKLIYLRPIGTYTDRDGRKYLYTEELRDQDLRIAHNLLIHYASRINYGFSPEHARSLLPFDFRQNFTVSYNVRSLMHFLDLRSKKDAQLEIRQLCDGIWPHFENWVPEIAEWYRENRWGKARLSP